MKRITWALLAVTFGMTMAASAATPGYYREPALHGDTIVFVAEGDLWRVSANGGQAQRLTTHPAAETQPVISADGRSVAFVASYDGAPDVYLMPLAGGEPQRLSFDASRAWLSGFGPQGEIVYASEYLVGPGMSRALRSVDPVSGRSRDIPLADARELVYSGDGGTAWFTRFGLAVSGDNAVGYRGGGMAQLWRWSTDDRSEAVRIARDMDANISQPMWWQEQLYVVSDAGGRANLWRMNGDGGDRHQLTHHEDFDVRGARLDGGRIVYQLGADLHLYDIASGTDRTLDISLDSDFLQRRERFLDEPARWIDRAEVNGDASRVVLGARGQAIVTGARSLRRASLAVPPHARVRSTSLSPDGRWVYAITDLEGRSEIWRYPADGSGNTRVLLADDGSYRLQLWPSPDGRWLAHADKNARLSILDLNTGRNRILDESPFGEDEAYDDVAWSRDGRYLAWSRPASSRQMAQVLVAEAAAGQGQLVTSDRYESFDPAFSPDGQWLYFLSNRNFKATPGSPWGDRNMGPMFDQRTRIFALALQAGLRSPFQPLDELAPARDDEDGKDDAEHKRDRKATATLPTIEFAGLSTRLFDTGLEAGNYSGLAVAGKQLYVLDRAAGSWGKAELRTATIEPGNSKLTRFLKDVRDFRLASDHEHLLVLKSGDEGNIGDILLLDAKAKAPDKLDESRVGIDGWKIAIDPAAEWRQMFDDAWRMHRAYSFDPGMRGVDWDAVHARLAPLVARVTDRLELDDLLGQMSSALGILHSQVRGGEYRSDPAAPAAAFLGAQLEPVDDGMRVAHIWRTDIELPRERAPLAQPGVDVHEGDIITAINGRSVTSAADVARALRAQAGQQVLLDVRRGTAPIRRIVRPVNAERDTMLRYSDWVRGNQAKVEQAGHGRIGYLHLYAMGAGDIASFAREFYAQYDRDGLIIDVRRNRGGNIDSWIIEKLLRRAWEFWAPPHGLPETNMQQTFRGHLVVLADEFTYSDGETFTAGVRALKLGPVIGMRTAGAGVWLSDGNRLADKGLARVANTAQFDMHGRWSVEGRGVPPDIEVENLPWATAHGHDAQLEAALAHLEQRLAQDPVPPLRPQPITPIGTPATVP